MDSKQIKQQREALSRVQNLTESEHSAQQNRVRSFVARADQIEARLNLLDQKLRDMETMIDESVRIIYEHMNAIESRIGTVDQNTLTKRTILEYMRLHNMIQE